MTSVAEATTLGGDHPNGIWTGYAYRVINDERPGMARDFRSDALQIGGDRRFSIGQAGNLVAGLALGLHDAESRGISTNDEGASGPLEIRSEGHSATLYGAWMPQPFLSFPVSVSYFGWDSTQDRIGTTLSPVRRAEFESRTLATSAGAALTMPVQPFLLTGIVRHNYAHYRREAYEQATNVDNTVFVNIPSETTILSQLTGELRATYLLSFGRVYGSAGYTIDIDRAPEQGDNTEVPLSLGMDVLYGSLTFGLAGSTALARRDIDAHSVRAILRLQF